MPRKGQIFILSAPSGAGKTTLCRHILERCPDMVYSISATTRAPRPGERDGVDYHFLSLETFKEKIETGRLAEWAEVHGNYYGTLRDSIEKTISQGKDLLLDVDVKGASSIQTLYDSCILIFIMPPSLEVLRSRLSIRGSNSPEDMARRMKNAEEEMAARGIYHHVIVNDTLDRAITELSELIASYRRKGSTDYS